MHPRASRTFGGFALLLLGCGGPPPPSAPSVLLTKPLPELHRRALDGEDVDTAQARGHVVVVDFFAKYCEPCRRALPVMQALHRDAPEVVIIGIGEDENESDVREMVDTYKLTFKVVHDRGNVVSGRFRVNALPMTFVAGPDGVIRWVGGDAIDGGDLGRVIAAARRPAE